MATNGTVNGQEVASPKIVLYTNHMCPYAHRAHITLSELRIPFEEIVIDLETPRPQWYLDINPRGLVPSIKYTVPGIYNEEILTESAVVSEFLCDSFPSNLLPASRGSPTAPLMRARINFFNDTFDSKISSFLFQSLSASPSEKPSKLDAWFSAVEKELEPLLANAKPFFNGSEDLTFAEVHTAPFILRWYGIAKDGEMLPREMAERLDSLPNFGKWARAVREHGSVKAGIWDEEKAVGGIKKRLKQMKAAKEGK